MTYDIEKLNEAVVEGRNEINSLFVRRNIKNADNIGASLEELKKIAYYKKGETDKLLESLENLHKSFLPSTDSLVSIQIQI